MKRTYNKERQFEIKKREWISEIGKEVDLPESSD